MSLRWTESIGKVVTGANRLADCPPSCASVIRRCTRNRPVLCQTRLTLLASDIVEAIVDGREPSGLSLEWFVKGLPVVWGEQRERLDFTTNDGESRNPTSSARTRCARLPRLTC